VKISLIADQAIGESDLRSGDGLGFETYAQVLATAAADTKGPFTIGVFGEWGTGKTSLLRLIKRQLDQNPQVVTVWFNAWRYDKEEHPIVPLVGTIIQELESRKDKTLKLGETRKSLIRALRAIAYGFSAKAKVKVPGFAEVEASFVAKEMIDREEGLKSDPLLDRSLYYGAFNSLDAVHLEGDTRVVVLIDDLDRCFPDQAIQLLESIKLVLAQPGFIFVLGVARRVIEGYLQHRYTTQYGINEFKGQLYLDKIVQLPFHVPPAVGRMATFSESLLKGQPAEVLDGLLPVLPVVAEALGGNPRSLIRFINNILIDTAISSDLAEKIPVQYFAISRCLEHRWPDVLAVLMSASDVAAAVATWDRSDFKAQAAGEGDFARVAAALLRERELEKLLLGPEGQDWLRNVELRQASIGFLLNQQRLSSLDAAEVRPRWDAFLSYHGSDRHEVVEIVAGLSDLGLTVFFDAEIKLGESFVGAIDDVLHSVPTVIYVMGSQTGESHYQQAELTGALAAERFIIPVLVGDVDSSSVPPQLRSRVYLDLREGVTEAKVRELADVIARRSRGSGASV
jgi:hypothetical protein